MRISSLHYVDCCCKHISSLIVKILSHFADNKHSNVDIILRFVSGPDIRLEYQRHLRIREIEFDSNQRIKSFSTRLNLDVERLTMLIREKKRID
jgi:hypothetical protein